MSTVTIIIFAAVFLAGLALGAFIIWFVLRRRKSPPSTEKPASVAQSTPVYETPDRQENKPSPLVFRINYVIAPVILAAVCLIIAVAFVAFLPSPLAFRFDSDGSVLTSMNKYAFVILMVALQIFSALAALAIAQAIVKVSRNMFKASEVPLRLDDFVSLMSNMVLLLQAILAYLMLDAFIYAIWSIHLLSFTLFAVLAVAIGSFVLIFMFVRLASRARSAIKQQ